MTSPDQPNKQGPPEGGSSSDDARRHDAPSSDFGSFVSSSVRSSFRQLKRESTLSGASTDQPPSAAQRPNRRSRQRDNAETQDASQSTKSGPVGRKWRDAISPPAPRQPSDDEQHDIEQDEAQESTGFDIGNWFRETFFDENGPTRKLYAAIAGLIVIILIVIFLLSMGGDGNGGGDNDVTPTATESNVLTTDRTSTPSNGTDATATEEAQTPTPEPTPTEEDFEGGDNQRT